MVRLVLGSYLYHVLNTAFPYAMPTCRTVNAYCQLPVCARKSVGGSLLSNFFAKCLPFSSLGSYIYSYIGAYMVYAW